jgi:hypothetical protein
MGSKIRLILAAIAALLLCGGLLATVATGGRTAGQRALVPERQPKLVPDRFASKQSTGPASSAKLLFGLLLPFLRSDDVSANSRRDGPAARNREFYFTRGAYSGFEVQGDMSWKVDYPKADRQFLIGLKRLVNHLDAFDLENPILLDDPELSRYPFLYAVEVGHMRLTDDEVAGLRRYLLAGGFLVADDFWGTWEWQNFEREMKRVLPEHEIEDLSLDHPIFHCFYDVREVVQVPNVGQGRSGGPTWERDGYWPVVRGIHDSRGRLLVVINWNSDLGDAWEWAEDPYYPLRFSTYAYQMGVNFVVYAMSH